MVRIAFKVRKKWTCEQCIRTIDNYWEENIDR